MSIKQPEKRETRFLQFYKDYRISLLQCESSFKQMLQDTSEKKSLKSLKNYDIITKICNSKYEMSKKLGNI